MQRVNSGWIGKLSASLDRHHVLYAVMSGLRNDGFSFRSFTPPFVFDPSQSPSQCCCSRCQQFQLGNGETALFKQQQQFLTDSTAGTENSNVERAIGKGRRQAVEWTI